MSTVQPTWSATLRNTVLPSRIPPHDRNSSGTYFGLARVGGDSETAYAVGNEIEDARCLSAKSVACVLASGTCIVPQRELLEIAGLLDDEVGWRVDEEGYHGKAGVKIRVL